MKLIHCSYLLLVIAVALPACVFGCSTPTTELNTPALTLPTETTLLVATTPTMTPTLAETQLLSPTVKPPIFTYPPRPTYTATLTPPATLKPEQAEEAIRTLLREPVDCPAPCFWGIVPGRTTLGEAANIFTHLGLRTKYTNTLDNKDFYDISYKFDSGLYISPLLTIQYDIVKNLRVHINPEKSKGPGVPREWLAYSPETLINRYGLPSKVGFWGEFRGPGGGTSVLYHMNLYFEKLDFIVEYQSGEMKSLLRVCPLTDHFESVSLWLGEDPVYPPSEMVLLEDATSMTMEEFAGLMTGDPENACFNLKVELLFP